MRVKARRRGERRGGYLGRESLEALEGNGGTLGSKHGRDEGVRGEGNEGRWGRRRSKRKEKQTLEIKGRARVKNNQHTHNRRRRHRAELSALKN